VASASEEILSRARECVDNAFGVSISDPNFVVAVVLSNIEIGSRY
jgi:hypothetical protein